MSDSAVLLNLKMLLNELFVSIPFDADFISYNFYLKSQFSSRQLGLLSGKYCV